MSKAQFQVQGTGSNTPLNVHKSSLILTGGTWSVQKKKPSSQICTSIPIKSHNDETNIHEIIMQLFVHKMLMT